MKAYFLQRLGAYIIDILLVSTLLSLIMMMVPGNKNLEKYTQEQTKLTEKYVQGEVATKDYLEQNVNLSYQIQRNRVPYSLIELVAIILYFVVFQFYNKGQTLGKKLMKIRVVSTKERELTINDLAIRTLLIQNVGVNILILAFSLLSSASVYFVADLVIEWLQLAFMIVTVAMVLIRKDGRGLHDLAASTQVVNE